MLALPVTQSVFALPSQIKACSPPSKVNVSGVITAVSSSSVPAYTHVRSTGGCVRHAPSCGGGSGDNGGGIQEKRTVVELGHKACGASSVHFKVRVVSRERGDGRQGSLGPCQNYRERQ